MNKIFIISLIFFLINTHAAVIKVTDNQDSKDLTQLADDGECSLREAIHAANTNKNVDACKAGGNLDYIKLDYSIEIITLDSKALEISSPISIQGSKPDKLVTIDADYKSRIFNVTGGPEKSILKLKNLSLINGRPFIGKSGGAIMSDTRLELKNVSFLNNEVIGGAYGGAIRSKFSMNILNCKFENNKADESGGAIYHTGESTIIINNSVFKSNKAQKTGGAASLHIHGTKARIHRIYNNSFKDNHLLSTTVDSFDYGGGALFIESKMTDTHNIKVMNNSFVRNSVKSGSGGAIHLKQIDSIFVNNTIAENSAKLTGGIHIMPKSMTAIGYNTIVRNTSNPDRSQINFAPFHSAGLYIGNKIKLEISNNIIAANHIDSFNLDADCFYAYNNEVTSEHNLISTSTHDCKLSHTKNIIGESAKLSKLVENSNRCRTKIGILNNLSSCTDYYDVNMNSKAIDGGNLPEVSAVKTDQYDLLRSIDGDNDGIVKLDIGAIEYGAIERNKKVFLNLNNLAGRLDVILNKKSGYSYYLGSIKKPISRQTSLKELTVGKGEVFLLEISAMPSKQQCTFSNNLNPIEIKDDTDEDIVVELTCRFDDVSISYAKPQNGKLSCTNDGKIQVGDSPTCTAIPDAGYRVKTWLDDCASRGKGVTCQFNYIEDKKTIGVTFEKGIQVYQIFKSSFE